MAGMTLQEIMAAQLPQSDMGGKVALPQAAPQGAPAAPKRGKGQIIMGIIADALAGAAGRPGAMAQHWGREDADARQQQQEQAQWHQRRSANLEDYGAQLRMKQQFEGPDVSPMERDAAAWQRMDEPTRQAYQQMKSMGAPDPDVFTTLPNGQFYAGPRSGLAAALGGGGVAPAKTAPRGKLTPVNGGQASAPGSFR